MHLTPYACARGKAIRLYIMCSIDRALVCSVDLLVHIKLLITVEEGTRNPKHYIMIPLKSEIDVS